VKTYTNLYKKLLLFFLTFLIFYDIKTEENEFPEESVQEEVEEIEDINSLKRTIKGINHNDIASLCALLAKQTVYQITGGNLEYNLKTLFDKINEIEVDINNVSIVAQLGLINTSAANPALTTDPVIYNFNVDDYSNNIAAALLAVTTAIITPSQTNTVAAQDLLSIAINDFENIIGDFYGDKSVISMYSLAEIYSALAQLNAQLGYLYILQS